MSAARGVPEALLREVCSGEGVPGHLKALVMEDKRYTAFSCTKPGAVTRQMERAGGIEAFFRPRLLINAVIVGIPEEKVETRVDQRLKELLMGIQ